MFHAEAADGGAGVLKNVPRATADADLRDQREDNVLGRDALGQRGIHADLISFRLLLKQALGRKHVLHLTGTDAKGQRAERAVRGRVTVAANDSEARLGEPKLRADHMDDAAVGALHAVEADAELGGVGLHLFDLRSSQRVRNGQRGIMRRDGVIHGGDGLIGPADFESALAQAGERLWGGYLVDEMQVDVKHSRGIRLLRDNVRVPDFLEEGFWHEQENREKKVAG